jgi:hypothetical protein
MLLIILRLIHILTASFWFGATLVNAYFLLPSIWAVGPAAGPVMMHVMQRRRMQLWINVAMSLAILSGLAMFGVHESAAHGAFSRSRMGTVLLVGAALAIAAAGVGGAMAQPAGRKLGALAQRLGSGAPPSGDTMAEMQALQARIGRALAIMSTLLVLSAAAMAVARYA